MKLSSRFILVIDVLFEESVDSARVMLIEYERTMDLEGCEHYFRSKGPLIFVVYLGLGGLLMIQFV